MKFVCKDCDRDFDTKHPVHEISSKSGVCGFCWTGDVERSYLVIEGTGSGKDYTTWVKKPDDPRGASALVNYHTRFTQRWQVIKRGKRSK